MPTDRSAGGWGWWILVALGVLLTLNGVALYTVIVETHVERTIGVLLTAFGALALAVAVRGLRTRDRWAWNASWIMVAALAAVGLHALRGDRMDLVLMYLGLAVVSLVGQLLARRSLDP